MCLIIRDVAGFQCALHVPMRARSLAHWEAALARRFPVEQLTEWRIRTMPSMKQLGSVVNQGRRQRVLHRHGKHAPPPIFPCERS